MGKGDYDYFDGPKPCQLAFPGVGDKIVGQRIKEDSQGNQSLEGITFRQLIPDKYPPYKKKIDVYDVFNDLLNDAEERLEKFKREHKQTSNKVDYLNTERMIKAYQTAMQLMRDTYFD